MATTYRQWARTYAAGAVRGTCTPYRLESVHPARQDVAPTSKVWHPLSFPADMTQFYRVDREGTESFIAFLDGFELGIFGTPEQAALVRARALASRRGRAAPAEPRDAQQVRPKLGTAIVTSATSRPAGSRPAPHERAAQRAAFAAQAEAQRAAQAAAQAAALPPSAFPPSAPKRARPMAARPVEVDSNGIPLRGTDGELLSEYERQRLLTIRQNQERLSSLLGGTTLLGGVGRPSAAGPSGGPNGEMGERGDDSEDGGEADGKSDAGGESESEESDGDGEVLMLEPMGPTNATNVMGAPASAPESSSSLTGA